MPSGEVPPTYDAVITGLAAGRERRNSSSSVLTARGRRGRSTSVQSAGSGGSPNGG